MRLIKLKEHQSKDFGLSCWPDDIPNESNKQKYLGLYYDYWQGKKSVKTSYFIGTCWLEENQLALQVQPKIKDLDYMSMFLKCFKHPIVSKELSKIYQIDFQKPKIALDQDNFEITPLLIVHFLQVVKSIVRKGLKKGYYPVEHTLNAKIKGRIDIGKTLKRHIFKGQNHKTVCAYQEFGLDCLENRLLKKALKFAQFYLANLAKSEIKTKENLKQTLAYCLAPFEQVGDEIDIRTIKQFKNNAFFKDYTQGLKLAKMILKRFAYNFKNTGTKQKTPPFWIDMSLLFELYTYALLLDDNEVAYQVKGCYGEVDFLIDKMIVDTKYKPKYRNYKNKEPKEYEYNINDIRQLAGYGRDEKIRNILGVSEEIVKCLVIYPNKEGRGSLGDELWVGAEEVKAFKEFRKIGVKLPQLTL